MLLILFYDSGKPKKQVFNDCLQSTVYRPFGRLDFWYKKTGRTKKKVIDTWNLNDWTKLCKFGPSYASLLLKKMTKKKIMTKKKSCGVLRKLITGNPTKNREPLKVRSEKWTYCTVSQITSSRWIPRSERSCSHRCCGTTPRSISKHFPPKQSVCNRLRWRHVFNETINDHCFSQSRHNMSLRPIQ
jgi:hypothetical protein